MKIVLCNFFCESIRAKLRIAGPSKVAPTAIAQSSSAWPAALGSSQSPSLSCWTQGQMRLRWPQSRFSATPLVREKQRVGNSGEGKTYHKTLTSLYLRRLDPLFACFAQRYEEIHLI